MSLYYILVNKKNTMQYYVDGAYSCYSTSVCNHPALHYDILHFKALCGAIMGYIDYMSSLLLL